MRVGSCVNYQAATNASSVPRPVLGSGGAEIHVVPALEGASHLRGEADTAHTLQWGSCGSPEVALSQPWDGAWGCGSQKLLPTADNGPWGP